MSLSGGACLAIWNDVEPDRETEYNHWHTHEHVPERCGVPGILEGRRYVDAGSAHRRYLTLYDLRDLGVLSSAAYRDLIQAPTPWSAAMRPAFRNFLREPCTLLATAGTGTGGVAASVRFALAKGAPPIIAAVARQAIALLAEEADLCAIALGVVADAEPHPLALGAGGEPSGGSRGLLLVEAAMRSGLARAEPGLVRAVTQAFDATEIEVKTYELVFSVRHPGSGPRAAFTGD